MKPALKAEIGRLTPTEKLQLVGALWTDLAANPEQIPIPAWHARLLDEDQAVYGVNPHEGSPWSEVKARIIRPT
ncbi:MAG TPA: addiction module protein [Lacunisphaera sp.]|jgi:putative addiction module component (TIGR02574 family)